MKDVQCYELFGGIALKNHAFAFARVFQSGSHYLTESTEAIQIKCLTQGYNILMQWIIEPSMCSL